MSRRYSIFLCVLFCAFIGVFGVLHLALPDREFSENENRELQELPVPKFSGRSANFFSGKFMSDFETYVTDQFPARDAFITVKAACELAVGKTVNNGVYFGADDTLFAGVDRPKDGTVETNLGYVDALVQNVDVPVYFSLVPNKLNIIGDKLSDPPLLAPFRSGGPLALSVNYLGEDLFAQAAGTRANWVDLMGVFQAHAGEGLFYRTDHHWTSLGAGYAAQALARAMGYEAPAMDSYEKTTVSTDFLGTTFSSAGAGWAEPDAIDVYVPDDGVSVTTYEGPEGQTGSLYNYDKLALKDKYAFFLGGNKPLIVVETERSGPKVLLIRDSYSDALAPFLTQWCAEIHLFDPRYNNSNLPQYVAEHDIDAVVVLYSTANFITDAHLFKLAIPAPARTVSGGTRALTQAEADALAAGAGPSWRELEPFSWEEVAGEVYTRLYPVEGGAVPLQVTSASPGDDPFFCGFAYEEEARAGDVGGYALQKTVTVEDGRTLTLVFHALAYGYFYGCDRIDVYDGGTLIQTISTLDAIRSQWPDQSLPYTESWSRDLYLTLDDMNFDGAGDIGLMAWVTSGANIPAYYWLWDPDSGQFRYAFCLSNAEADAARRQLVCHTRVGWGEYHTEYYGYDGDGQLQLQARTVEREGEVAQTYELIDGALQRTG